MARFTNENAADYGRRGGERSHQRIETQYADLVLRNPSVAGRVARLIRQGHRLGLALRGVKIVDKLNQEGR